MPGWDVSQSTMYSEMKLSYFLARSPPWAGLRYDCNSLVRSLGKFSESLALIREGIERGEDRIRQDTRRFSKREGERHRLPTLRFACHSKNYLTSDPGPSLAET